MRNSRGFTLLELMVVVGIIGILAMIAIPSYKGYAAKARQKQGFSLLNSYFTAAQTAHGEFGHFPGNFMETGFQPVGQLYYRLRSEDGKDTGTSLIDNSCTRTRNDYPCNCSGGCNSFKKWNEMNDPDNNGSAGVPGLRLGPSDASGGVCGQQPFTNDHSFRVTVGGVVTLSSSSFDSYSMDNTKTMTLCRDGLH